ncbi:C39 family peptidase [Lachnoclostridium sp. Marseille-P6806]|uniref:C39 family peptidase n=1 Tax=Lachnoclostridium sp. Marseille-P6806 TaxID=2364793 RepID=UPI001030BEA5|nr:C39 family peptidase [Lachnoclostridium sp. Marseille-P6806]
MASKRILIPCIDQRERWPTGCESVTAVMLLRYLGIPLSVDEFIRHYLPMRELTLFMGADGRTDLTPASENIIGTGPDPDEYFAGSPYDPAAFGCYPGVLVRALNRVFAEYAPADGCGRPAFAAKDVTGVQTERLLREYIDQGVPVAYWATLDLAEPIPGPSWRLDGGELFTWISREHCMLLVGYDEERGELLFNDPWHGLAAAAYPRELAERRHAGQGERAAAVRRL